MPDAPTSRTGTDAAAIGTDGATHGALAAANDALAARVVAALRDRSTYPHAADDLQLRETLISWIALAGPYAYKLKKPIRYAFIDYSTPERRRAACVTELELNRRFAPRLYLGLERLEFAVDGSGGAGFVRVGSNADSSAGGEARERARATATPGGADAPIAEYAVRMRRFDADAELDVLVRAGAVGAADLRAFGASVAGWQQTAPDTPPSPALGAPATLLRAARDTLATLRTSAAPLAGARLDALERWLLATYAELGPWLQRRRDAGRVRECHGDLHARNVVRDDGALVAFDGIDFDPRLRWIDVASDAAFLVMDLHRLARPDLACAFLDGWFDANGDYDAARGLRWWLAYRALVRAKVDALRARQASAVGAPAAHAWRECAQLVTLAEDFAHRRRGALFLTIGPSGSGKSWLAQRLAGELPAIRIRSDVERRRLAGLSPEARSGSAPDAGLYTPEFGARTYARLLEAALAVVGAGVDCIVDAAFLQPERRAGFAAAATERGIAHAWLECDAPPATLRARVAARRGDPSEATLEVLARQLERHTPLTLVERRRALRVDTGGDVDVAAVAAALRAAAAPPDAPPHASAPAS